MASHRPVSVIMKTVAVRDEAREENLTMCEVKHEAVNFQEQRKVGRLGETVPILFGMGRE